MYKPALRPKVFQIDCSACKDEQASQDKNLMAKTAKDIHATQGTLTY